MRSIIRLICGALAAMTAVAAMAVEEPVFRVERGEEPFQLREYPGFVVAETFVQGDFDSAGRTGFRRIAGYIFGKNVSARGDAAKIAMTAPVTMEPASERIAMTAPVTTEATGEGWRIHFVMPSAYRIADLPRPLDPEVRLREVPPHQVAAITFSGWTTRASIAENTARLEAWMTRQGLKPAGRPQVARYNDPFTLPWNRRNEILIEVAPQPTR